jgi:hypothetical protein
MTETPQVATRPINYLERVLLHGKRLPMGDAAGSVLRISLHNA